MSDTHGEGTTETSMSFEAAEVPDFEPVQIVNRIHAAMIESMPVADQVGAFLAMADDAFGVLLGEHGGLVDGLRISVDKGEMPVEEGETESVYVATFEALRPFGWTAPATNEKGGE